MISVRHRPHALRMPRLVLVFAALIGIGHGAQAAVSLASPFGDHMVLQQSRPVPVCGTATAGEAVVVKFAGQARNAIADSDGRWRVDLAELAATSEPRTMTVSGAADTPSITLTDVVVGEVWICGGQSNMEYQMNPPPPLRPIVDGEQEMAAATFPLIRQFSVPRAKAYAPQS